MKNHGSPPRALTSPAVDERVSGSPVALKFKLTLLALGASPKDLCNHFAAVNPRTAMTQQNAYKWLAGKSAPRMFQVYDDWARVLGGDLTGAFIAAASIHEFATSISARYAIPSTALKDLMHDVPQDRELGPLVSSANGTWAADQLFLGRYLALSPAWSPAQAGKLILGHTEVVQENGAVPQLTYSEIFFGQRVDMVGALHCDGRTAQSMVRCRQSGKYFFFAFQVPPPPANLIGGVFSGSAIHDASARPVACRILLVRDHAKDRQLTNRATYMAASADLIGGLLVSLGYDREKDCLSLADRFQAFLMGEASPALLDIQPNALGQLGQELDSLVMQSD